MASTRYVWGQYTITQEYYNTTIYQGQLTPGSGSYRWDLVSSNNYQWVMGSGFNISQSSGRLSITGARTYTGGQGMAKVNYGEGYIEKSSSLIIYGTEWIGRNYWFQEGFCIEADSWGEITAVPHTSQAYYNVRGSLLGYVSSADSGAYPQDSTRNNLWYTYQGSDSIDPDGVVLPQDVEGGTSIYVTITPSSSQIYDITTSYKCQYRLNGGEWTDYTTIFNTQFSLAIPLGTKTIQVRVQAKDNGGFTSDTWVESETKEVINGTPPSISSPLGNSPMDLGYMYEPFTFDYTVKDQDWGDVLVVTETLSDAGGKPYTKTHTDVQSGTTFESETAAEDALFQMIPNDTPVNITINVTDKNDLTATPYIVNFKKSVNEVTITLEKPMSVQGSITEAIIYLVGYIPDDAEFYIKATNNANDEEVIWQDVTLNVLRGSLFEFDHASSDTNAAFNFELYAKRGESQETGYIDEIMGAFK